MESYLGEIKVLPYNRIPRSWLPCNGQLIAINQNSALFSLLGTSYGGDGVRTFALPNLQGRVPVHSASLGQAGGLPSATLTIDNIPTHTHSISISNADPDNGSPQNSLLSKTGENIFAPVTAGAPIAMANSIGQPASVPVTNMQPYLGLSVCICVAGIYPSRS